MVRFVLRTVEDKAFLTLAKTDADALDELLPVHPLRLVPCVPGEAPLNLV